MTNTHLLFNKILVAFSPFYVRFSLIGGSVLLWTYLIQVVSGLLIALVYSWVFDSGLPGVVYFWWETFWGSILARIHSEFGNIVFCTMYIHILLKLWVSAYQAELDHTWISGILIMAFTYVAGITGAIMPCSVLSEVTATVIGYAINSLSFIKFDFLETILIPGLGLTDETAVRVFIIHAIIPVLAIVISLDHINNLHSTEYTDDDEMELIFLFRHEYWHEFIWLETGFWYEVFVLFLFLRFNADFFYPSFITVSYAMSNFEYWPLTEEIDFVLAIPHWYLRPLMGSLVLIPHHYLGFFYVIFFFLLLFMLPWTDVNGGITFPDTTIDFIFMKLPQDLNMILFFLFSLFIMVLLYTTLIVPTGRYFVSLGSSEFLIFAYWFIIVFLLFFIKLGLYMFLSIYFSLN